VRKVIQLESSISAQYRSFVSANRRDSSRMKAAPTEPLMALPVVACLLALTGGVLSGFTYATVKLYSTVQSGNVVLVGYALEIGASAQWRNAVLAIACFGLGSAATAFVQNLMSALNTDYSTVILTIEAIV